MHPLTQRLAALQRRLAIRERAVAACRIAAIVIAAAILFGAVDYLVRFNDRGLRLLATAAFVAIATWAVYRWWYVRRRRLSPLVVARQVETHFPQLRDSLASAVEFLQQDENDRTAGSAQLRRIVIADVQNTVEGLPLDDVIDRRPLRRAATWLALAIAVVAACLAWDAGAVQIALARLAAPLGTADWPRQHYLAFREVPQRLAAGQTFEVELFDRRGKLPPDVRVDYRINDAGNRQQLTEPMLRVGDATFARRENVQHSFAFRARGGDDDTMPWHYVEVIEPPELKSLSITTHPPAYTGLPSAAAERHLEVLEGTGIEVSGIASERLSAARILPNEADPIAADVRNDSTAGEQSAFHIDPKQWIAHKSGPYRLELTDAEGVSSIVGEWNLRTQADPPPSVSWQQPSGDLHVTPQALLPVVLDVKDNLAVRQVELVYERSDLSEAELEREPSKPRIELYRGPAQAAPPGKKVAESAGGETRIEEYQWDIGSLALPAGAELTISAEASDYRPGIGKANSPRRITIITADELTKRLAERQTQIVRQLERALAILRTTLTEISQFEVKEPDSPDEAASKRRAFQSAEINQRRVARILVDENEGVTDLIDALLAEIEINRVSETTLRETMDRLAAELKRLASGPLDTADRELTAARKGNEAPLPRDAAAISESLSLAVAAQEEVIAALEQLISELSGKADFSRYVRLLTELRLDQIAHEQSARTSLGINTRSLQLDELTRAQRTQLEQAAAHQQSIASRFEKIERGMDQLAKELAQSHDEAAEALTRAVDLARQLTIGAGMQETARDFGANRVGQALGRQSKIADHLQQMLDVLKKRAQTDQMAESLRDAESRLNELRKQLADLGTEIKKTEADARAQMDERRAELDREQQKLRKETEQLGQQLERLEANDASQSVKSAANRLNKRPLDAKQPSSSQQIKQAESDLEQAADQLAQRRQQAEDDLVLEMVRRFLAELEKMVERQRHVLKRTVELDKSRSHGQPDKKAAHSVEALVAEERELAELAREHSELLFGLAVVRVSLEDAERRLIVAAELLKPGVTGPLTQQAELIALARLEAMAEALAQTAAEATQNQNQNAPPPPGQGDERPQRRPTFELLEVKLLRMMQTELNERTQAHEQRIASLKNPPSEPERQDLEREARELATEQGRLAELVQNMLTRHNKQ